MSESQQYFFEKEIFSPYRIRTRWRAANHRQDGNSKTITRIFIFETTFLETERWRVPTPNIDRAVDALPGTSNNEDPARTKG